MAAVVVLFTVFLAKFEEFFFVQNVRFDLAVANEFVLQFQRCDVSFERVVGGTVSGLVCSSLILDQGLTFGKRPLVFRKKTASRAFEGITTRRPGVCVKNTSPDWLW